MFQAQGVAADGKGRIPGSLAIFGRLYDPHLSHEKISALYALRCALAHDYTLYNIPKKLERVNLIHHFGVCGAGSPFVTLPKTRWDMNLKGYVSSDEETWINLEKVQDLVEAMYRKLRSLAKTNDLEVNLEGGPEALSKHYILRFTLKRV
jgi:hypothetical protein